MTSKMALKRKIWGVVFTLPALLLVSTFLLSAIVRTVYYSFFDWNGITAKKFVGFKNYIKFFNDEILLTALTNTAIWVAITLAVVVPASLIIAVFLRGFPGAKMFKSVFCVPMALSFVSTGTIWSYIFRGDGVLNQTLHLLGMEGSINFLTEPLNATISMAVAYCWASIGGNLIMYLTGIGTLPQDQLDASLIDGCNFWQRFRYVINPLLKPFHTIVIGQAIVNSFKMFDLVISMTGGGPARATETIAVAMFSETFTKSKWGYGSAISIILTMVILPLTLWYLGFTFKTDVADDK